MILEQKVGKKPGILKQVYNWFTNSSLFRGAKTLWIGAHTKEVIIDIKADTAISEGFCGNTAVYSIVMKDANKFASIPRYLLDVKALDKAVHRKLKIKEKATTYYTTKAYSEEVIINNKLSKILERPNKHQGQAAFFKQVRAYYKICGEAVIELNRGEVDRNMTDQQVEVMEIIEMYVLPPNKIKLIPDPEDVWGVLGYHLQMGGLDRFIHRKNIIYWKDVNLKWDSVTREHLRGMPCLVPGEETLQANQDGERSTVRMMQNDGSKGAVYGKSLEAGSMNAQQESQIRAVIDGKVNNNNVKGSVASIFGIGELGYINFGGTSVDMQLLQAKDQSWKYLCALFDVPFLLFDPEATFANLREAKKNWINDSIIPASKELDDELNRVLLRAFKLEGKAIIACDYTELPELQEDMKLLSEWLNTSDEITPNEKRIAKGYEARTEKEFDEPWIGGKPMSMILSENDDGFGDLMRGIQEEKVNGKIPATNGKAN